MVKTTKAQRKALHRKWLQADQGLTYKEFRKTLQYYDRHCVIVRWCNMWLGIEADGYTHT